MFRVGDEFICDVQANDRHYKVISVNPIYENVQTGKRVIDMILYIESMHTKQEHWGEVNSKLYEKFRFFKTTAKGFQRMLRSSKMKKIK